MSRLSRFLSPPPAPAASSKALSPPELKEIVNTVLAFSEHGRTDMIEGMFFPKWPTPQGIEILKNLGQKAAQARKPFTQLTSKSKHEQLLSALRDYLQHPDETHASTVRSMAQQSVNKTKGTPIKRDIANAIMRRLEVDFPLNSGPLQENIALLHLDGFTPDTLVASFLKMTSEAMKSLTPTQIECIIATCFESGWPKENELSILGVLFSVKKNDKTKVLVDAIQHYQAGVICSHDLAGTLDKLQSKPLTREAAFLAQSTRVQLARDKASGHVFI